MSEVINTSFVGEDKEETLSSGADVTGMAVSSPGAALRILREHKKWSVSEVAQRLKVGPRQIEALESDLWSALPGAAFVKGLVRNYARLLEVDSKPLLHRLDEIMITIPARLDVPACDDHPLPVSGRGRDHKLLIVGVGILLLAVSAVLVPVNTWRALLGFMEGSKGERREAVSVPASTVPYGTVERPDEKKKLEPPAEVTSAGGGATGMVPASVPSLPGASSSSIAQGSSPSTLTPPPTSTLSSGSHPSSAALVPLRVRFAKASWLEVRDSKGRLVISQNYPAGATAEMEIEAPAAVVVGNARGASVTFRGQAVDLAPYQRGEVARLNLK